MLKIVSSNLFKKDLKRAVKRGMKIEKLKEVVNTLARREPLAPQFRDHALTGSSKLFRECHIEPDWLLVYRIKDEELELFLFRTGSHSDLF